MFCQLRKGLQIVYIKPCTSKPCACFVAFKKKKELTNGMPIEQTEYKDYQYCYKRGNQTKDTTQFFLYP